VHLSAGQLALASAIVAVGAMVQGSIGFGINVVGAPLLVLIDTRFVPGPTLAAALVLTVLVGLRDRGSVDRRGFGWLFVGRVPGSIVAALVVGVLPERGIAFALAAVVLIGVVMSITGWRIPRRPANVVAVGAVSGVMNTLSSVGGPPIALLYQDARGGELRGTLAAVFTIGALVSIGLLAAVGRFGTTELLVSLVLVPGVIVGFVASIWTAPLLDRHALRPAILALSALAAVAAVLRYAL
jgi:uncharacterized membrane protein YfcA